MRKRKLFRKTGSDVITYPGSSQKQGLFLEYKMASAGATIWLPDTERFFMELITMSSEFFVRRLKEYERTLSVLTTRIEKSSQ